MSSRDDNDIARSKILIVDDESINHFALSSVLDFHFKLKADSAFCGQEAITLIY